MKWFGTPPEGDARGSDSKVTRNYIHGLHSLFIPVLMSYFNADGIVWIYKGTMINSHKTGEKMFITGSSRTLPK